MGNFTMVFDQFRHKSIGGTTQIHLSSSCICRFHMHLHGHMDIIKGSFIDKLLFAPKVFDCSFFTQCIPIINFDHFFRWHSK